MGTLRARVANGRLLVDEPTNLPDGTVLDLVVDDEGDDLDEADRQALHAALAKSRAAADVGNVQPASRILKKIEHQ